MAVSGQATSAARKGKQSLDRAGRVFDSYARKLQTFPKRRLAA